MNYRVVGIITILILATGAAIAFANARLVPSSSLAAPPLSKAAVGGSAPAFHVTTTNGMPFDSATANEPFVVEVFATWCPHCQREVPLLNQFWSENQGRFSFIAVSGSPYAMDGTSAGSLQDVERFTDALGVQYPIAYDADLDVAKKYLQGGYPTIVFVNRAGKITAIESGEVPLSTLQTDLAKASRPHA